MHSCPTGQELTSCYWSWSDKLTLLKEVSLTRLYWGRCSRNSLASCSSCAAVIFLGFGGKIKVKRGR